MSLAQPSLAISGAFTVYYFDPKYEIAPLGFSKMMQFFEDYLLFLDPGVLVQFPFKAVDGEDGHQIDSSNKYQS